MPTDLVRALTHKTAAQKRETRETTFVLVLISLGGAFFTIARAVQSEAFEFALLATAVLE
jgi:hypothetical protein